MQRTPICGAIASIVFGVAGIVWFTLEAAPPRLGFDDTDDPAVSLRFLHDHPEIYAQGGVALFVMAIALMIFTFAVSDSLASRADSLAIRSASAFGLLSAALFFMHGVVRLSVRPLLYIDSLDRDWGEAAYVVQQMVGAHGFAQGAITALCIWAVGISLIGFRTRVLPLALCALGIIPAFRLLGILGPLGVLPDDLGYLWIVFMISIPGTLLWCLSLGVVLLRRASTASVDLAPVGV